MKRARGRSAIAALALLGCDATLDFHDDAETAETSDSADGGGNGDGRTDSAGDPCTKNGCPLTTLHCDESSGSCVECVRDGDCAGDLHCETTLHACVHCRDDGDCAQLDSICVLTAHQCLRACTSSVDCGGKPGQRCEPSLGACAMCAVGDVGPPGGGCHPPRPICDPLILQCVECATDADCASDVAHPRCDLVQSRCVGCTRTNDCKAPLPLCDPFRHACVAG